MVNYVFERNYHSTRRKRPTVTIPNQSMKIDEIVRRFVKGIPVDIVQRQAVYVDQSEHDLEAMSRMDFAEKAAVADLMRERAEQQQSELQAIERVKREKKQKREDEQQRARTAKTDTGIDPLDNTMPVDPKLNIK